MEFYLAPMQSVTGYIFRNAYHKHFPKMDKYFTPFIADRKLGWKDKNEILPEHNKGMQVVPQILTNHADVFLEITEQLMDYGYQSVNFNLGCPSATVVTKKRGAGLLGYPEELERLLDEIFEKCRLRISIKTRIGIDEAVEWGRLQKIYNQFPLEELIIHPRLQVEQYKSTPHLEVFAEALKGSKCKVCYNGDIHSLQQYENLIAEFPFLTAMMLGRGMVKNPGLLGEIQGESEMTIEKLRAFHDDVLKGYQEVLSGDTNILFKMKELWSYLGENFPTEEKLLKKIRKSKNLAEYKSVVNALIK